MIYLLYSKDKEVIWRYIDKLIQKNNIEENSIIKYTLNEETLHPILEECNTLGLFSIKKLIIVDITLALSNKEDYEEIIKYLDNYNKDIILIFTFFQDKIDTRKKIYKKISTIGKVEYLSKDNNYLINLVKEILDKDNFKISDYDINYFLEKVGTDIINIENELEKLKNYCYNLKLITRNDIDLLCINNDEEEIFALSDAIIKNDTKRAIKLYNIFLTKNYEVQQMIGLIASQFRFLLQVKILYNKNKTNDEISKILEVHPYRVKLAINNSYYYSKELLEDYLLKLFEIDRKIKLGLADKNILFELFILNKNI